MKNNKTTDWQDYWRKFDELIELLKADSKIEIIAEFKEAQKSVNGLTDGWFEFKFAFEKVIKSYRQEMTDEQIHIAVFFDFDFRQITNKQIKEKKRPHNTRLCSQAG